VTSTARARPAANITPSNTARTLRMITLLVTWRTAARPGTIQPVWRNGQRIRGSPDRKGPPDGMMTSPREGGPTRSEGVRRIAAVVAGDHDAEDVRGGGAVLGARREPAAACGIGTDGDGFREGASGVAWSGGGRRGRRALLEQRV